MTTPRLALAAAAAGGLLVPGFAQAHGQEALVLGLCLPSLVIPGLFLLSLLVWRADVATKWLTAAALVGVGVAMVGINLALLNAGPLPLLDDPTVGNIWWWGVPVAAQVAAWIAVAHWRRHRGVSARS